MLPHKIWVARLFGQEGQKQLRICYKGSPTDVTLTIFNDAPQAQEDGGSTSSAKPAGWTIQVAFVASPDNILLDRSFVSETEAKNAYGDLVKATAEVEGLIRQEKMDEASKKTDELIRKYSANSTQVPSDQSTA